MIKHVVQKTVYHKLNLTVNNSENAIRDASVLIQKNEYNTNK